MHCFSLCILENLIRHLIVFLSLLSHLCLSDLGILIFFQLLLSANANPNPKPKKVVRSWVRFVYWFSGSSFSFWVCFVYWFQISIDLLGCFQGNKLRKNMMYELWSMVIRTAPQQGQINWLILIKKDFFFSWWKKPFYVYVLPQFLNECHILCSWRLLWAASIDPEPCWKV